MALIAHLLVVFLCLGFSQAAYAAPDYGISDFGELKYPPAFTHFDYVNPDAPKGGGVKFAEIGTYDSLNPYIIKGIAAAGIGLTADTLMTSSDDEEFARYGLLAERIELAADKSAVTFTLRKEARWHDGTPVAAEDVVFSFNTITTKGHPFYRSYYAEIKKAEASDSHTVTFYFANNNNRELPLIIGDLPIISKAWYTTHDFEKSSLEAPLGSGPYRIEAIEPGKWIKYRRVEDYWGKDLPVNKGKYNFDSVQYDYYRDATVAVEAFKAGEYDFRQENISKVWANAYDMPEIAQGKVIKEEIPNHIPTGMQGFFINTRRDKFKDRRVRAALGYAFDFEWTNKNLFNGAYTRTESYFSNSIYASHGLPEGKELALLEPFRSQLPQEVFTKAFHPPATDGSGNIRENLKKARDLLAEAGWLIKNNQLVNDKGKPMKIEFLLVNPSFERVVAPVLKNLKKLGIEAKMRTVDSAQYVRRLEDFDFDITVSVRGQSNAPGNEQMDYWHSSRVSMPGSQNLSGIRDPVADALIEKVIKATSKDELVSATRALDRVLLWGHYVVPNWHVRNFRVIYWNKFDRPKILPKYALGLFNWWVDAEKESKLLKK